MAVTSIIQAHASLKEKKTGRKLPTRTIEVDTALASTVSEVLGYHTIH
ncbi:MAG: hypothetical protein J7K02_01450 [Deltaproteobacteria bacterium]|nr:hypothetical protein [Deltaproteobacteria bacterium]